MPILQMTITKPPIQTISIPDVWQLLDVMATNKSVMTEIDIDFEFLQALNVRNMYGD